MQYSGRRISYFTGNSGNTPRYTFPVDETKGCIVYFTSLIVFPSHPDCFVQIVSISGKYALKISSFDSPVFPCISSILESISFTYSILSSKLLSFQLDSDTFNSSNPKESIEEEVFCSIFSKSGIFLLFYFFYLYPVCIR